MMTTATTDDVELRPRIAMSNFRVEYIAPKLEAPFTEGYCSILADDAQFDGATVRVFDVPDPDESQREVAQFACEAMNERESFGELLSAVRELITAAATFDSRIHAGFSIRQLSTEQSRMYNAINTAKAAVYEIERKQKETPCTK